MRGRWEEIVGTLILKGHTPESIGQLSLYHVFTAIYASEREQRYMARAMGATFPDEEERVEIDPQNAQNLAAMLNGAIKGNR